MLENNYQLNLFDESLTTGRTMRGPKCGKRRDAVFNDYESFVRKFTDKPKTTDDCYTPPEVYNCILDWVNREITPLGGRTVLRPFYPGGDYESVDYRPGDIVIDNPPFSILSKIKKFYALHNVDYFLFAPSLTLFTSEASARETYIVAAADIKYHNGATVKTSFVTNCYPRDIRVALRGDLHKAIDAIQPSKGFTLPKYVYPNTVITSALLNKIAERGVCFEIPSKEAFRIRRLDSQIATGKALFGGGYLISERAAAERAAAERAAAERAAAERAAAERAAARERFEFPLSEREKKIIQELNRYADTE